MPFAISQSMAGQNYQNRHTAAELKSTF